MGARADTDLYDALNKIIHDLNQTANNEVSLTPALIRLLTEHLTIVRNCHVTLAEFEALVNSHQADVSNVVEMHSRRVTA